MESSGGKSFSETKNAKGSREVLSGERSSQGPHLKEPPKSC